MTFTKTINRPFGKSFPSMFENIFNDFEKSYVEKTVSSQVPANVVETAEAFHLELNAAGRSKENFTLQLEQNMLTIAYEPQVTEGQSVLKFVRKEFGQGAFKRSFSLDEKIDIENIEAKYEDGLLKVLLPKKAEVKPANKQISIL